LVWLIFLFFGGTRVWTQGLTLARQVLYHLSHFTSPVLFFWDRVSWTICLGWLWTSILLISASWVARITDLSPAGLVILEMGSLELLAQIKPQTMILFISASQEARITGMTHWYLATLFSE
jgi:hypothetical protein